MCKLYISNSFVLKYFRIQYVWIWIWAKKKIMKFYWNVISIFITRTSLFDNYLYILQIVSKKIEKWQ